MAEANISIVVVSDYEGKKVKTWKDEKKILSALAEQDFNGNYPVYLVENEMAKDSVPNELYEIYPDLKIIFSPEIQSSKLKDIGVQHTTSEYVAVFEADCQPNIIWLRVLYNILNNNPNISVVSGRTGYGENTMYKRVLTVLDRSFDHLGKADVTTHISNNGALYRRNILEKYPYPDILSPFLSSRMRTHSMLQDGIQFYFDPQAFMHHAIGGISFIYDFRRNTGFADMMKQSDIRYSKIPYLLWKRSKREVHDCLRVGSKYLKWYDWPFLLFFILLAPSLQIPGMIEAVQGKKAPSNTAYR